MKPFRVKAKKNGQIFTPDFIVQSMLDYCNYKGTQVVGKHIIDNSCGDGAFLRSVVCIYIEVARTEGLSNDEIKCHLETYIHGVDSDKVALDACKENLTYVAQEYGLFNIKWDLYNGSSLTLRKFDGIMDYVVGNPPYVRVHNLASSYEDVKTYKFANGGMTDLYLAFFELGFNMLAPHGQLCYITPSSWLNSVAAENMRKYIVENCNLVALIDLEHFQAFDNATTYTLISHFQKSYNESQFDYYTYNRVTGKRDFVEKLKLQDIYIDSYFYLGESSRLDMIREIKTKPCKKYVSVKNGFATLADSVFIGEGVPESEITIRVIKASTGKLYKCLFPYDEKGKPLLEEQALANPKVKEYFHANKSLLLKGKEESPGWYLFGRTQALADVSRPKLSVNTLIRQKRDLKLTDVKEGDGVYSGLYVVADCDMDIEVIKEILISEDFVEYVKTLKKYKRGGYYTFNSKDVEQFINYCLTYKLNVRYALESIIFDGTSTPF